MSRPTLFTGGQVITGVHDEPLLDGAVLVDGTDIVGLAGVFHCIVMHVPDPTWIFDDGFETADPSVWSAVSP